MSLFGIFGKKAKGNPPREPERAEEADLFSGMRVEVTTLDGELLFAAKMRGLRGERAELRQYPRPGLSVETPLPVRIRGFSEYDQKAIYMEGVVSAMPQHMWSVTELTVISIGNDRACVRLATDLDATVSMFSEQTMEETPCKILDISEGGCCISSGHQYQEGDQFLLKVQLDRNAPESAIYCQVLRAIETNSPGFHYGSQLVGLTEESREQIVQSLFAIRRREKENRQE